MIYLNNATVGHPKSPSVLEALWAAIVNIPNDTRHSASGEADIDACRQRAADVLGCHPDQLLFTPDATTGINLVLRGFLNAGDVCAVDNRAHNAVLRTVNQIEKVIWSEFELYSVQDSVNHNAISELPSKTRLVCLTHASNVSGTVYPIGELIAAIKSRLPQTYVAVDAAQSAGIADPWEFGLADFVIISGHKYLHSVSGAAAVVAKMPLRPLMFGGTGRNSSSLEIEPRDSLEVGTPNIPAIHALTVALEHWSANRTKTALVVSDIRGELLEKVKRLRYATPILLRSQMHTGTLALRVHRGRAESEWAPFLRHFGVITRGGLHCSPLQHKQMGLLEHGTLRLSVSRFTSESDVQGAFDALCSFEDVLDGGNEPSKPPPEPTHDTRLRAEIREVRPCSDLAGAVEVSGRMSGADQGYLFEILSRGGWRALNRNTYPRVMMNGRAMLMLAPNSDFTLTRVESLDAARSMLAHLDIETVVVWRL